MPELPEIVVYIEALERLVVGHRLDRIRIANPFFLRTYDPPIEEVQGRRLLGLRRIGKRIVFVLEGELFVVLHLMIAGRPHYVDRDAKLGRIGVASLDFDDSSLVITEAGTKHRASLHVVRGEAALRALDPGGLEPLSSTPEQFGEALQRESHTVKRALTDPRLFSGIGNAYSDEILHRAKVAPLDNTRKLTADEITRLHAATQVVFGNAIERLHQISGDRFPTEITAFQSWHAVHGKFKKPCPVCGTLVQRIRYADNETNYCPKCQTGGKIYADRSLSRLLKGDWPRSLDELEERGR
jgi:formamidopyrimidine-DNA glycosylase